MNAGEAFSALLRGHRSIRRFKPDPIDQSVIETVCAEGPWPGPRRRVISTRSRSSWVCPSDERLLALYADREVKGWNRYRSMGQEIVAEMAAHGITSLAQFYTSDLKYAPARCEATSRRLFRRLIENGFTDRLVAEPGICDPAATATLETPADP